MSFITLGTGKFGLLSRLRNWFTKRHVEQKSQRQQFSSKWQNRDRHYKHFITCNLRYGVARPHAA
jgi:hypothetical protein